MKFFDSDCSTAPPNHTHPDTGTLLLVGFLYQPGLPGYLYEKRIITTVIIIEDGEYELQWFAEIHELKRGHPKCTRLIYIINNDIDVM